MAPPPPPLDEQEFDQPGSLAGLPGQALQGNNLFWYFTSSPWFEAMSINIAVYNNVQMLPEGQHIMNDRRLWEERLRAEPSGVQFIAAAEPQAEGQPWVLQRQNKVHNPTTGDIDTHAEGNWYTHGTKVLMAPSLLHVVQSRLLTISTRMQQLAHISTNMAHWSPATGYSYFPPSYEATKLQSTASRTASRTASPILAPTDPDAAASHPQGTATAAPATDAAASTTDFSDALFMHSLNLTNAYGDEYMDENPLKGEPGAFVFENTKTAVDARNKAQGQAAQALPPGPPVPADSTKTDTQASSIAPSAAPTPKSTATPAGVEAPSRKGSVAPVPKKNKNRRKSQAGLASPTTPKVL